MFYYLVAFSNNSIANNVVNRTALNPVGLIDVRDDRFGKTELDGCLVADGSCHDISCLSYFKGECRVLEDRAPRNSCRNEFTIPLSPVQHVFKTKCGGNVAWKSCDMYV